MNASRFSWPTKFGGRPPAIFMNTRWDASGSWLAEEAGTIG